MFITSVLRPSIKIGAITSCFEVAFFVSEQKKFLNLFSSLIRNSFLFSGGKFDRVVV